MIARGWDQQAAFLEVDDDLALHVPAGLELDRGAPALVAAAGSQRGGVEAIDDRARIGLEGEVNVRRGIAARGHQAKLVRHDQFRGQASPDRQASAEVLRTG